MVQHLAETSGTNTNDSTSNNNDGTKLSATEPNPTTSGQINGAQDFDGTNDLITISNFPNTFDFNGAFTLSLWIQKTTSAANKDLISNWRFANIGGVSNHGMFLEFAEADKLRFTYRNNGTGVFDFGQSSTITDSALHHVVAVYDPSLGSANARVYLDGSQMSVTANATSTFSITGRSTLIGSLDGGADSFNRYFDGLIDEVKISNTARSAAWIAASYKSETDTFNTYNTEEERYASSGTLTSSIFDTEQQSNWGTLTYNTDGVATTVVKARTSNSSSMTGATDFTTCNAITSGSDISGNNCVTDTHRYIQYQIGLTSVSANTPTFQDVSIAFTASDTTPPSISLTALSPDPNNDNTPSLTGTATDSIGTVSNVQFQMDSTSGSWSSCTASDGSFNSASEAFSCTASTLTDGSHTMYVRATDSNGNTTSSSYASDTFTIDATTPVSIDLDSPGDNSYTNSERPTYKWKATTDATAGLSKYVLEIDNPSLGSSQASGDFTIDNIPTSGTTDITSNNKYVIHFENFNDSDSTNNYISVYTKSSSEWSTDSNSGQNDGKLREGKVSWKVKARDNVGNETSSSRTLFVDRTGPKVEFTQVNDTPFTSSNFSTTDKTPTIYGKITDPLSGGDSSQTQDENGPKIASGPKQVDIKVEKKEGIGYKLITLYTINMDKPWYTCDNKEVTDNSKQKCDKYLPFEYTSKENLELGAYKITLTGKDKADNSSGETTLTLNVTTLAQITTPEEKKIIEEEIKPLKPEEQEKVKEELEITKPVEPSALEKAGEQISQTSKTVLNTTGNIISAVFNGIGQGVKFTIDTTGKVFAFVGDKGGQALAFVGKTTSNTLAVLYNGTQSILAYVGQGIGSGIASNVGKTTLSIAQNTSKTIGNIASTVTNTTSTVAHNTGSAIANATQNTVKATKSQIANIAFAIGERTQGVAGDFSLALIQFAYNFVPEPTKISDVQVATLSPTQVKITWKTNHPANGKVNYGLDRTYPFDVQSEKRITHHEFALTDLKPDTLYYFEVMSHNKNYVYDANREFKTPAVAGVQKEK